MRLSNIEKSALKFSLRNFKGKIFLFGSRISDNKKGGDIDILLVPDHKIKNELECLLKLQSSFFSKCEQKIDIVIYKDNDLFCKEIINNAERIDIERI